jgi:hypothetical protein
MEYLRPDMRTLGLHICIGLFYCVGSIAVPWVALVAREWRSFLLYLSAPMLLVPCYYRLLPESASWLIQSGRVQEAVSCFQRISAFNGKGELPSAAVDAFKVTLSAALQTGEKRGNVHRLYESGYIILSRVGVIYTKGFGLDDWIYCALYIHTTRDYRQLQRHCYSTHFPVHRYTHN